MGVTDHNCIFIVVTSVTVNKYINGIVTNAKSVTTLKLLDTPADLKNSTQELGYTRILLRRQH